MIVKKIIKVVQVKRTLTSARLLQDCSNLLIYSLTTKWFEILHQK
jgi:hypothetical protein